MKVAFVGTITCYRQIDVKGVPAGQIDVLQVGDHKRPTKTVTINVYDQSYCRIILETLQEVKLPIMRAIMWIVADKSEILCDLLQLVSINESLLLEGES